MGGHGGHGGHGADGDKHAGYGWLAFCALGMLCSLTFYGIVLEYATSGNRKIHEISFLFITTSIYALTGLTTRELMGHKPAVGLSKYQTLLLSMTSIASTFTSVRSLRYVIYPVQILFKSCKPVPVMLFGVILGKKYSVRKYVNVMIITAGVALFMGGGSSSSKPGGADNTLIGALLLSVSLCFDGATGAYEDKMMSESEISPFDLMFNIQLGKSMLSFCALMITNGINDFFVTINSGGFSLVALGFTGAIGQIFLFLTISKFGALNCALLGLLRKMLSLVLSFVLYGHTLNAVQTVGLALAIASMVANFYEKGGDKGHGHGHGKKASPGDQVEAVDGETNALLVEAGKAGDGAPADPSSNDVENQGLALELPETAAAKELREIRASLEVNNKGKKEKNPLAVENSSSKVAEDKDLIDLEPNMIEFNVVSPKMTTTTTTI